MQRNQARQAALKALEEDPTVFQYDEVYEDMQQKKEEKKPPKEERKVNFKEIICFWARSNYLFPVPCSPSTSRISWRRPNCVK